MQSTINRLLALASLLALATTAQAQPTQISVNQLLGQQRVITTPVPFLLITPDSRAGGMGDAGVATSPDANSMHWNPAKMAFAPRDFTIGLTYTPWLKGLGINDIALSYIGMVKRIDNLSAIGGSLRYFSLGDIQFTDNFGNKLRDFRPYEVAADLGYARKLSDRMSLALAGRFIYSNLAGDLSQGAMTAKPGVAGAADISLFWTNPDFSIGKRDDAVFSWGVNISNLGNKITYSNSSMRDFLPANLRAGASLTYPINEYNKITFALDFNKLLVPTRPVYQIDPITGSYVMDSVTGRPVIERGRDNMDKSVLGGAIGSFTDAPDGFKEELTEINPSIGIEYIYQDKFFVRTGYFHEHRNKGNRQYATFGVGVIYNIMQVDFAYLVPTNTANAAVTSPLEKTLRISLIFNFGQERK